MSDHTDDPEAENAVAGIVTDRQGWTALDVRYGIAADVVRWFQANRPRTVTDTEAGR